MNNICTLACKPEVLGSNPSIGQLFFKLFWPLVKCSKSTPRELNSQERLMTEGVVDRPVEFRELGGI